jgi:hypothetical protein
MYQADAGFDGAAAATAAAAAAASAYHEYMQHQVCACLRRQRTCNESSSTELCSISNSKVATIAGVVLKFLVGTVDSTAQVVVAEDDNIMRIASAPTLGRMITAVAASDVTDTTIVACAVAALILTRGQPVVVVRWTTVITEDNSSSNRTNPRQH